MSCPFWKNLYRARITQQWDSSSKGDGIFILIVRACPSFVSVAVIKTTTQSILGRKKFISSYTSRKQSITELCQGRNLEVGPEAEAMRVLLVSYALLSLLSYTAQDHLTTVVLHTVVWTLPNQSLVRIMIPQTCPQPIWWRKFLNWDSLFPSDTILGQFDKNPNQHIWPPSQHRKWERGGDEKEEKEEEEGEEKGVWGAARHTGNGEMTLPLSARNICLAQITDIWVCLLLKCIEFCYIHYERKHLFVTTLKIFTKRHGSRRVQK